MSEPEVNGAKIGLLSRRLAWEVLEAVAAGAYADVAESGPFVKTPVSSGSRPGHRAGLWMHPLASMAGWLVGSSRQSSSP